MQTDEESLAPDYFTELIGLEWDEISPTRITAHLDVEDKHLQSFGLLHGGVCTAVVEVMASLGAFLNRAGDGTVPVGITNTTDFIRSHQSGRLQAEAKPINLDQPHQLWEVEIRRAVDNKLVATGQVRFANLSSNKLAISETDPG